MDSINEEEVSKEDFKVSKEDNKEELIEEDFREEEEEDLEILQSNFKLFNLLNFKSD